MLIDTQYDMRSGVLTASYIEKGSIKMKYFNWKNPTTFVVCDDDDPNKHPRFKSWDRKSVREVPVEGYPDRYSIYEFLDTKISKEEHDMLFKYEEPDIYFVDIETEATEDGYSEPEDANNRILSISLVFSDKIMLLGLEEMPKEMIDRIENKTNEYFKKFNASYKLKYIKYDSEFDMISDFFNRMVPKMPLITGWNFLRYDWMYLVNRARKIKKVVNGIEKTINPNISSPTKKMSKVFGASSEFELPAHRLIFDYMQLYEVLDTSIKVKESSSLDFVSNKLFGVKKLHYDGSLQNLYEKDFEKFMLYNAIDSALVQRIHETQNYISIVYAISTLAKINATAVISQMNNALGSLAITEGVLRGRFRDMDNVVIFRDKSKSVGEDEPIEGGYVKDPIVGFNRHCAIYDFASLYPTSQMQWFIAPETFVGISKDGINIDNGLKVDLNKHVICVNGCVFEKRISPTLKMLSDVYSDRKKNKKEMNNRKIQISKLKAEKENLQKMLLEID